ncbi:MAG: DUF4366 domain-containing protein [Lachnospiraceae bacterium]|nr:DUF4366 domain-containing protein [Lachnospiraceae bacterium]
MCNCKKSKKMDEILKAIKINELLKKEEPVEEKKSHKVLWVFAIIGAIVAIAGIAYALYRYFTPDYLEDFEDDFDEDFDDDFFEEEECEECECAEASEEAPVEE